MYLTLKYITVINSIGVAFMVNEKVLYMDKECILIWKYENGYCEVQWGEEVILIHKSEIKQLDSN
jgi:hypothetical protein